MSLIGHKISARYSLDELIGEGAMSEVYKGTDTQTHQPVAIKILKAETNSNRIEDVIRFRREAQTVAKLSHPNLAKIYEVGEYQGSNYIVMEFIPGKSLAAYINNKKKLEIDQAIEIIIQISQALDYVHNLGVIHRDLKPDNIIVIEQSNIPTIKLLDFGLAQVMELTSIKKTEEIVGTFSYMSPEQSGIIKNAVDERSDLYSLGIIFFELISGELPFKGDSVGVILHQQVAKEPPSLKSIKKDIPLIIEDIVLKLLKKDPQERYQSAKGVKEDLQRYLAGEPAFILGKGDKLKRFIYHTRLTGREQEFNKLKNLYFDAYQGKGAACLISGEAGRGKSRLVDELRAYVYEQGGEIICGNCFDQANKIPYQPFTEALNEYLKIINQLPQIKKQARVNQMRQSLGGLGEIIYQINPLLKEILGDMPPLVKLESDKENQRFLMICAQFFQSLGRQDAPLVIILDDLHWADEGSLKLLNELIEGLKNSFVMVVGLYRDNEVDKNHSVAKIIQEAKVRQIPLEQIQLNNFDLATLNRMVSELLLENELKTYELSSYIYNKSKGNPFFVLEIIRQLVDNKVLVYKQDKWILEKESLACIEVSDTMLGTLLKRLDLLRDDQERLLSIAAVIGKKFKIDLLYILSEESKETVISLVDEGMDLQLLEKGTERGDILFVHDRIKDAFYHKIGEDKKKELHLKIAQVIENLYKDNLDQFLFDLANHYAEAKDREKCLQYALPAAEKAKESYAHEEAIKYYRLAISILEEKQLQRASQWVKAKEALTEVYLIAGRNDDAIEVAQDLLSLKENILEKARLYCQIGTAYFKKGHWQECEDNLARGLGLLGEKIPRKKQAVVISILIQLVIHIVHCVFPKWFIAKVNITKTKDKEVVLFYIALTWLYVLTDLNKLVCNVLKNINIAESRVSKSKELGISICSYASLCMAIPLFNRAIKYHEKSLFLRGELNDEWGSAQSLQLLGYCYQWKGEHKKSITYLEQSQDKFTKLGDIWELGMVSNGLGLAWRALAEYNKAIDYFNKYLENSQKLKNYYGISNSQENLSLCYSEIGDFKRAEDLGKNALILSKEKNIWYIYCVSNIHLGYLELERKNFDKALQYLEEAQRLYENNKFIKDYTVVIYNHLADSYIEKFKETSLSLGINIKKEKLGKINKLCKKALNSTKPWPNHYGGALRVMAKYYCLVDRPIQARVYFSKSIEHLTKIGRPYELAKTYYEYGVFLNSQDDKAKAKSYFQQAYDIFKKIGARIYVEKTSDLLGVKQETADTAQDRLVKQQELSSVVKVSHYLSSILDLDALLEKIMDICMETAGAERGFLFLYSDNDNQEELDIKVSRNLEKEVFANEEFAISRTIIEQVKQKQDAVIVVDAALDRELKQHLSVVKYGLRSVLCVPLTARGKMIGLVYLDNRLVGELFTTDKLEFLKILCAQAAISIENAQLYKQVENYSKTLEQKVKERTKELMNTQNELIHAEKLATLGTLAGGIAHEINSPLATILVNTQMLLELTSDPAQKESLELIQKSVKHCGSIVKQLLEYSRKGKEELEDVNIENIIEEASQFLEHQFLDLGITITKQYNQASQVKGNHTELTQVIMNLLLNSKDAIMATYVNTERKTGNINIKTYQKDNAIIIEIKDDGCGIPQEYLTRVFDPFVTTKDIGKGTGLGLAVSSRIIERHQGKIEIESVFTKMTLVRVKLPVL